MRRKQYRELRAALEAEAETLEAKAGEARRKIEALDLVWNDLLNAGRDEQSAAPLAESLGLGEPGKFQRGCMAIQIDEAVRQISGQFKVIDIERLIQSNHPDMPADYINRTTISGRLRRLCGDDGPLEVLEVGSGRRPTLYQKKEVFLQESDGPELKIM